MCRFDPYNVLDRLMPMHMSNAYILVTIIFCRHLVTDAAEVHCRITSRVADTDNHHSLASVTVLMSVDIANNILQIH